MVDQYSNFFVSFSKIGIILFSLMMMIARQRNPLYPWLNFWKRKVLFLAAKCMNLSHLSNCKLLKNTRRVRRIDTYVGAETIRWNFKNKTSNIKCKRPRLTVGAFLYTCRCMMTECTLIITSHAINCNTLLRCYV